MHGLTEPFKHETFSFPVSFLDCCSLMFYTTALCRDFG